MYDELDKEELIKMLDKAIKELQEIAEDEIYLVSNGKICRTYESIFYYLKDKAIK